MQSQANWARVTAPIIGPTRPQYPVRLLMLSHTQSPSGHSAVFWYCHFLVVFPRLQKRPPEHGSWTRVFRDDCQGLQKPSDSLDSSASSEPSQQLSPSLEAGRDIMQLSCPLFCSIPHSLLTTLKRIVQPLNNFQGGVFTTSQGGHSVLG